MSISAEKLEELKTILECTPEDNIPAGLLQIYEKISKAKSRCTVNGIVTTEEFIMLSALYELITGSLRDVDVKCDISPAPDAEMPTESAQDTIVTSEGCVKEGDSVSFQFKDELAEGTVINVNDDHVRVAVVGDIAKYRKFDIEELTIKKD